MKLVEMGEMHGMSDPMPFPGLMLQCSSEEECRQAAPLLRREVVLLAADDPRLGTGSAPAAPKASEPYQPEPLAKDGASAFDKAFGACPEDDDLDLFAHGRGQTKLSAPKASASNLRNDSEGSDECEESSGDCQWSTCPVHGIKASPAAWGLPTHGRSTSEVRPTTQSSQKVPNEVSEEAMLHKQLLGLREHSILLGRDNERLRAELAQQRSEAGQPERDSPNFRPKALDEFASRGFERVNRRPADAPIPMVLTCPLCKQQHIDEDSWATLAHRTHRCVAGPYGTGCGHEWRPSNVATVGVRKADLRRERGPHAEKAKEAARANDRGSDGDGTSLSEGRSGAGQDAAQSVPPAASGNADRVIHNARPAVQKILDSLAWEKALDAPPRVTPNASPAPTGSGTNPYDNGWHAALNVVRSDPDFRERVLRGAVKATPTPGPAPERQNPWAKVFGSCPDLPEPCAKCGEAICECAAPSSSVDPSKVHGTREEWVVATQRENVRRIEAEGVLEAVAKLLKPFCEMCHGEDCPARLCEDEDCECPRVGDDVVHETYAICDCCSGPIDEALSLIAAHHALTTPKGGAER